METLEANVQNSMLELHKSLTKILKENNVITGEQLEGQQ